MVGKATISVLILALLLLTTSIFIATVDLRSYLYPILLPRPGGRFPCSTGGGPLMVYMYDLPRRFHVGMLRRRSPADESPVTAENLPPWPSNSGLKKQHSVEYWMMASLLYDGGGGNETREAVRVWDPEMADAFFVPFFSSLSFNTHGHNMTDPDTEFDRQLQIDILKILRESKYWQRSGGRDHVIPMHHPNAFRFFREQEGIVRAKLAKLLAGYDDVIYEQSFASGANIKVVCTILIDLSTQGMRSSKFCLHPAGDTPSSCRLFDAIVSHCVPVIVSDQIELPYEDEIDYTQFSIFFSDKEALEPGYMIEQLRQIPKERWVEMWRHLKYISHHYEFQYPPKKGDAIDMLWRQVKHKLPRANLDVHRSRRLKVPDWWDHRR
ncbi:probable arabinosyltransferase ARAD1 isoform X5 [Vitis vinifera]|uniref:probable arabinosyltransferase ARAD1 isoform X5 n=1 Tax=Vitis vinifera TaxID=29760 RepID=UPI0028833E7F|nr:probable arabinosyltransferase ARAD1 isoform X5 [Vitis vinifera]